MQTMSFVCLAIAIVAEVIGTTALKASESFTKPLPALLAVASYGLAFYFLALTLRVIPVGIAYAIWSGLGIVLISIAGWVLFRQSLDMPALIGLALIIGGVVVINVFSGSVAH